MIIASYFLIAVFFLLSVFFSGIETGLISIDRLKLEKDARNSKKKKQVLNFLENPDRMFGTILFGNNISIVIISSLSIYIFNSWKKATSITEEIITLILAGLILVFAEIIPKAIFREKSNRLVPRFIPLLIFFSTLLIPFVKFVSALNSLFARIFRLPNQNGAYLVTREDISNILEESLKGSALHEHQREMLEEALEFSELKAENVMIHRTEIAALPEKTPLDEVIAIAKKEGYTRFPVYGDDLDDIKGILIIYDLLQKNEKKLSAEDFVRKAYYAPETMDVNKLLTEMQNHKNSMAIIVDAFGGTAGLVTIEDILEEIVGEIEDEYDTTSEEIEIIGKNSYLVQGFVEIDFLNDEFNMNLPEGDYETIAGLIIDQLAKIPPRKTKLKINDCEITVIQATNTKIIKVQIDLLENNIDASHKN